MKPQRPGAPSVCATCLYFYTCNLQQVTDQCPVIKHPKPKEEPFDEEFDTLYSNDGDFKGGGTP